MMMNATGGNTTVADRMVDSLTKGNTQYKTLRGSGPRHDFGNRVGETAEQEVDRMLLNTTSGTAAARQAKEVERVEKQEAEMLGGTRSVAFGRGTCGGRSRPMTA